MYWEKKWIRVYCPSFCLLMWYIIQANNPAYSRLLDQRKMVEEVIEEVVTFQHGGLNNSVDTMSDVVKEYMHGRADIQGLRKSLNETQSVLTSKKSGQIPLKELWLKKVEVEESLRIVRELESLKVLLASCIVTLPIITITVMAHV